MSLNSIVDGSRVRIITPPNPQCYPDGYLLRAKIEIDGVEKNSLSTFFPKNWDVDRVLEETGLIISNPSNQLGNNIRTFQGIASDGVTNIEVRLTGTINNLNFDTVFPK